jgi:orotidine-5'-phosphate decarboxylase
MQTLIVALDVDTLSDARRLADALRGEVGGFKIGSQLFTSHGPSIVEELVGHGDRVFLDLKFHDIPNTVAGAVRAATRLGAWMLTVHASGGAEMMRAARAAADDESARVNRPAPLVIGVTVLTSLADLALGQIGVGGPIADQVQRLAALAEAAGLDGVVASPLEIATVRQACRVDFTIVTPGIRGADDKKSDQTRTMSAADAIAAGASYLVVGRPITRTADPRAAARRMAASCASLAR